MKYRCCHWCSRYYSEITVGKVYIAIYYNKSDNSIFIKNDK